MPKLKTLNICSKIAFLIQSSGFKLFAIRMIESFAANDLSLGVAKGDGTEFVMDIQPTARYMGIRIHGRSLLPFGIKWYYPKAYPTGSSLS